MKVIEMFITKNKQTKHNPNKLTSRGDENVTVRFTFHRGLLTTDAWRTKFGDVNFEEITAE